MTGAQQAGAVGDSAPRSASHGLWTAVGLVVLVGVGVAGRLHGINSSLWLDEFGTLWCVNGNAAAAVERALAFHGQTPFYYLTVWASYWSFGPSEWALRLPSIVSWVVFTVTLVGAAFRLGGRDAVVPAVVVATVSIPLVVYAASARPYMAALALLMASLLCLERARSTGRFRDAIFFGLAGGLSILAHYLVGLGFVGAAIPLLVIHRLRRSLSVAAVLAAGIAATATAAIGLPQFLDLLGRRGALEWLDAPALFTSAGLFLPLIPAVAVGVWQRTLHASEHGHLFASATIPLATVSAAYAAGLNLVHPRYLLGAYPAAALLTSVAMARRGRASRLALLVLFLANGAGLYWMWSVSGTATLVNFQDWRGAADQIARLVDQEPNAVVLYRSGFVEQDIPPLGQLRSVDLSPLQSPGQRPLTARVLPLSYRWDAIEASGYLEWLKDTALRPGTTVVYLSPGDAFGREYSASFTRWLNDAGKPSSLIVYPVTGLTVLAARIP